VPGGGPHPRDEDLFAPHRLGVLRRAASELAWLRRHDYALPSALKLVGDRYQLRDRQRSALKRATSGAGGEGGRAARRAEGGLPEALWVDGFNVVITLETALNGGVLVSTVDGTLRDLAGIHGSYRVSERTHTALELLAGDQAARGWSGVAVRWLLDAPVSNTGRLAAKIRACGEAAGLAWEVEVVPDPDVVLADAPQGVVVASGDAPVLDACPAWIDWAGPCVRAGCPQAWILELELAATSAGLWPRVLDAGPVTLRPPVAADAAWIFRDYAQDPQVTRFLTWAPHTALQDTQDFLTVLLDGWAEGRGSPWIIERRSDGRGLGMIDARRHGPMVELGYVLAREHWGQGTMTEVVSALSETLLGSGGARRVWAVCDVENHGSARTLEKAGFTREGTLSRYCCRPTTGDLSTVHLYARVSPCAP
jgi:RimJ/RimL family protein N-acetyltransferase